MDDKKTCNKSKNETHVYVNSAINPTLLNESQELIFQESGEYQKNESVLVLDDITCGGEHKRQWTR